MYNYQEETTKQFFYMLPDKAERDAVFALHNKPAQIFGISFLIFLAVIICLVPVTMAVKAIFENFAYVMFGLCAAFIVTLITLLAVNNRKKFKILKTRYAALKCEPERHANRITLHEMFYEYNRKWNKRYLIFLVVFVGALLVVNLTYFFIQGRGNLIASFLTVLAALVTFVVFVVKNLKDYKAYRKDAGDIEASIEAEMSPYFD